MSGLGEKACSGVRTAGAKLADEPDGRACEKQGTFNPGNGAGATHTSELAAPPEAAELHTVTTLASARIKVLLCSCIVRLEALPLERRPRRGGACGEVLVCTWFGRPEVALCVSQSRSSRAWPMATDTDSRLCPLKSEVEIAPHLGCALVLARERRTISPIHLHEHHPSANLRPCRCQQATSCQMAGGRWQVAGGEVGSAIAIAERGDK